MTDYRSFYTGSHVLLIGIDNYTQFAPLATAIKGVREMSHVLRDTLGFENIITLEDEQATQRNILRSLTDPLSHRENGVGRKAWSFIICFSFG